MKINKEGYKILINTFIIFLAVVLLNFFFIKVAIINYILLILFMLIVAFFRHPKREPVLEKGAVIAPCDGKVVAIKEVYEPEYIKGDAIQISIFMNMFNVHVNWFPIKGRVLYYRYHPGKYLVAMYRKSSEKNERTTVVIEQQEGCSVLVRQIAGYIARRIVCYAKEGHEVNSGDQLGFIKFGSRVDLFLPLESRVQVTKGERVKGLKTIIAKLPSLQQLA